MKKYKSFTFLADMFLFFFPPLTSVPTKVVFVWPLGSCLPVASVLIFSILHPHYFTLYDLLCPSKHLTPVYQLHCVTSQKTAILFVSIMLYNICRHC
jgi:hypothetical protein